MGKKKLEDCRSGRDFVSYANTRGGYVDRQTGSHAIVRAPSGGTVPVPIHPGDIPTGTRHSIMRRFKLLGLAVFIISSLIYLLP